jgi:hypothetical protein
MSAARPIDSRWPVLRPLRQLSDPGNEIFPGLLLGNKVTQKNNPIRGVRAALTGVCFALSLFWGCSIDVAGTTPPAQALFFPTTMELSPDGRYAYIVNSNFNQTYSSGWISVVDLDLALAATESNNESIISREDGGQLRVPSLGGELALSADGTSALMPHRGLNPRSEVMITQLNLSTDGRVDCGDPEFSAGFTGREAATDCDEDHLIRVREDGTDDIDPTITPRDEVYSWQQENGYHATSFTWTDADGSGREMVAIGYVNSGIIRFYELKDGKYSFVDILTTELATTGRIGIHPGTEAPFFIAAGSANTVSKVCSVDLLRSFSEPETVVYSHAQPPNGGQKVFAFDFMPGGQELLVANRARVESSGPGTDSYANSLVKLDATLQRTTELQNDGSWDNQALRPAMTAQETVLLNGRATDVKAFTKLNGDQLVAVPGFDSNKLSIFSAGGGALNLIAQLSQDDIVPGTLGVGESPVTVRHTQRDGKDLLLVLNFSDHSLSIIDVSADFASDFSLVTKVQNASN